MGYEDYVKSKDRIEKTSLIWKKINDFPEKFKIGVEKKSKIIFYEDLYKQLTQDDKQHIESAEELKNDLKMFFKCENKSYSFIKSYKEYALNQFERGYLWNKITSEIKYDSYFKEVEIIDKNKEEKSVIILYTKMFEAIKKTYPSYFNSKKDLKRVLNNYFKNNNITSVFTDDKNLFDNYTNTIVDTFKKNK